MGNEWETDPGVERSVSTVSVGRAPCYRSRVRPVEARYDDGILKPVRPLQLRQGEQVAVIVLRRPDSRRWDLNRLAARGAEDETLDSADLDAWAEGLDGEDRR